MSVTRGEAGTGPAKKLPTNLRALSLAVMKRTSIGVGLVVVLIVTALLAGCGKQSVEPLSQATPTWGPGQQLLWSDAKGNDWKNLRERVLISDRYGHSLRQLVKLKQGTFISSALRASQDGQWVSFIAGSQQTTYLCLVRLAGGKSTHYSCPTQADELYTFSPDSRWLAYQISGVIHLYRPSDGKDAVASLAITSDVRVAWAADSKGVFYGAFPLIPKGYNSPERVVLRYAGTDGSTKVLRDIKGQPVRSVFVLASVSDDSILLWSLKEKKDYLFNLSTRRLSTVSTPLVLNSIAGHPGDVTFSGDGRKMAIRDSQQHWRICPTSVLAAGLRWSQCTELPSAVGAEDPQGPGSFSSILNFDGSAAIDYRVTAHGYSSSLVDLTTGSRWLLRSYTYKNQ